MKTDKMEAFGIVTVCALAAGNVLHLLWTVWLVSEQVETGWGYGTTMELGVLWPWLTEVLCAPALMLGAVYLVLATFKPTRKRLRIGNIASFAVLALQYAVTNLFIWY